MGRVHTHLSGPTSGLQGGMFLLLVTGLGLVSADLFGSPPLVSTPPPWESRGHDQSPSGFFGSTGHPFPTNVWWQNMVLEQGDLINAVNPYIVKTMNDGLHVCLPDFFGAENFYGMAFVDNLIMSAAEDVGAHSVKSYDELSVTVGWNGLEAPIVRGMPYATVKYSGKTPSLRFGGAVMSPSGQVSGTRFEVTLNNQQKWIIYSSSDITFTVNGNNLDASGAFTGSIRAAGVWESGENAVGDVATLDAHAGSVPVAGTVSANVEGDTAILEFQWKVEGGGDLLMMALPHQQDIITNSVTAHKSKVLKGMMVGYTGNTWTFNTPLTTITWGAPRPLPAGKDSAVRAALAGDIAGVSCCGDDPYFGGKQMAVLARLAIIAEELGEAALAQQARDRVKPFIEGWLGGTNGDKLVYEQVWGGVCSLNGLNDHNADFGNGMYNDHHFHYGYHIYTAAVLAKADPAWGAQWEDAVLHMISDVAEPSRESEWYTFTRTKDWYDGHAWASGIFKFGDGKNQESTSESVNGWYAIYLWGLARGDSRVRDLGRLMTSLEIRAAWSYWQMTSAKSNFPAPFSNNKAVGIQWSTKVDYGTWFGANVEFIHCIQMLPFTPISEELLPSSWIQEEYQILQQVFLELDAKFYSNLSGLQSTRPPTVRGMEGLCDNGACHHRPRGSMGGGSAVDRLRRREHQVEHVVLDRNPAWLE